MGEYTEGSQISRAEAWDDLKDDFERFKEVSHVFVDVWVNLWRIAGVSDRDRSQLLGRFTAAAVVLGAVVLAIV